MRGTDHLRELREGRVDVQAGRQRAAELVEEGELLLVALGRVGQAGPVEREGALGRHVLEQVAVRAAAGTSGRLSKPTPIDPNGRPSASFSGRTTKVGSKSTRRLSRSG